MSKTRDTGYLNNVIKTDTNGNVTFINGSTTLMSISASGAVTTTGVISGSNALSASYAQTASYANAFTVANTLTAQTLVVQTITSSVDFVTGSTRFGSISSNTMQVTGSLLISGSSTAFAVNNNALFVSSSGFVGIGTTTFSNGNFSNSAVGLNISASAPISLLRDAAGNTFYMGLTLNAYLGTQNAIPMYFLTSDTIRMTITSGGNLGIGYTLPTVALQVSGTIAVGNATTTGWGRFSYDVATNQVRIQASKDGTDSVPISFYTQASGGGFAERMIISGSNVGIGTSTPSYALDINDTNGSGVRGMRISTSSSSVGPSIILRYAPGGLTNWLIGTSQAVSNTLEFIASNSVSGDPGTAGTTRMQITAGGIVSIGTTNTSRQLNVFESIGVRVNQTGTEQEIFFLGRTGSSVNDGIFNIFDNGVRKVNIAANNSRGGDTYFNGGGNVAIGTDTASYRLHVNGTAYATGAAGALSDIRHKNNILNINAGLDAVMLLRPISYLWNEELITDDGMQGLHFGFIAQEVKEILPDVILEQNNEEKTLGLKYNEIIPVLVKAIQEQQAQINELKAQING
jgi:hypothetical protein